MTVGMKRFSSDPSSGILFRKRFRLEVDFPGASGKNLNIAGQSQPSISCSFAKYHQPSFSGDWRSKTACAPGKFWAENRKVTPFSGEGRSLTSSSIIRLVSPTNGSLTRPRSGSVKTHVLSVFFGEIINIVFIWDGSLVGGILPVTLLPKCPPRPRLLASSS